MKHSIIIPSLGRETLIQVVKAIIDCENFAMTKAEMPKVSAEIIVILNGEKNFDKITAVLKKFAKNIKIFISSKPNVSIARNLGLKNSTGEIISFIGDDTVPEKNWLQIIHNFYRNKNKNTALLGKISWTPELQNDPFHQWLENNAQFDFANIKKKGASWKHFYTSNITVPKNIIGDEKFRENFKGWGFEDSEFGYRLVKKKGMKIVYNSACKVLHHHYQSLEQVCLQTKNSRKNALLFESLHPEIKILPQGPKLFCLKIGILLSTILLLFYPRNSRENSTLYWWKCWKQAWITKEPSS